MILYAQEHSQPGTWSHEPCVATSFPLIAGWKAEYTIPHETPKRNHQTYMQSALQVTQGDIRPDVIEPGLQATRQVVYLQKQLCPPGSAAGHSPHAHTGPGPAR